MDIEASWNNFLRKKSRAKSTTTCPLCQETLPSTAEAAFRDHVESHHPAALDENAAKEGKEEWISGLWKVASTVGASSGPAPPTGESGTPLITAVANESGAASSRGLGQVAQELEAQGPTSPASSLKREGSRSVSPPKHANSKTVSPAAPADNPSDFDRGISQRGTGTLWEPADGTPRGRPPYDQSNVAAKNRIRVSQRSQASHHSQASAHRGSAHVDDENPPPMIKQPETRPISQEQLVAEVKGIYAGLVMVESKCIEVDSMQDTQNEPPSQKLTNEQWQALIALHRTLLHEHHDFFLASQHPSASGPLRRLASKYAMPARMWRHGIHSFLELLRHRLPHSLEQMLTFIYLAYSMMALLYETVPTFEDTWIECLGDLGRYRMAIEDEDLKDREVWTIVSRGWYSKASDKAPTTGRLYHHLAILARPHALQQLYYYAKSLCVAVPFLSARESIMTLFDPIMALASNHQSRLPAAEFAFVRCHGIMFSYKFPENLQSSMDDFGATFDGYIARSGRNFNEYGYNVAIANCCAVIGYGNEENVVYKEIRELPSQQTAVPSQPDHPMEGSGIQENSAAEAATPVPAPVPGSRPPFDQLAMAVKLSNLADNVVFRRFGDANTLSYLHVRLAFVYHLTFYPDVLNPIVAPGFPWKLAAAYLNTLIAVVTAAAGSAIEMTLKRIEDDVFPEIVGDEYNGPQAEIAAMGIRRRRPLPDDYAMRGLLWTDKYEPDDYFQYELLDDEDKYFEVASMAEQRRERCLYLGVRIASVGNGRYLTYENGVFGAGPEFDIELEGLPTRESKDLGVLPDAAAV